MWRPARALLAARFATAIVKGIVRRLFARKRNGVVAPLTRRCNWRGVESTPLNDGMPADEVAARVLLVLVLGFALARQVVQLASDARRRV